VILCSSETPSSLPKKDSNSIKFLITSIFS
jgi:hypothetical protein